MTNEIDHLRRFHAAAAEPDPDARAVARATLLDAVAAEPEADQAGSSRAPRRERPRRRLLAGLGGLAVAGAAAVAIALLSGLGGGDVQPQPATAAQLLRDAADGAAQQPYVPLIPGQYWYTKTSGDAQLAGGGGGRPSLRVTLPSMHEEWSPYAGWGRTRTVFGIRPRFPTALARRNWIAAGRPWAGTSDDNRVAPQHALGEGLETPGPLSPRALRALPTDADVLYGQISAVARRQVAEQRLPARHVSEAMWVRIVSLLNQGQAPTPPALRAALYRVLARVPRVELRGRTTDRLGRPGSVVGFATPGRRIDLVIDPATGTLLEERTVLLEDAYDLTGDFRRIPETRQPAGLTSRTTHVAAGIVDSVRARP